MTTKLVTDTTKKSFKVKQLSSEKNLLTVVFLLVAVTAIAYTLLVTGTRGTDQFWYLSDIQTLIDGKPPLTNTVFPGMVLRQNLADPITYFAHNGPFLYLNATIGKAIGAFNAWKVSNFVFFLFAAIFTFLTTRELLNYKWALLAALLYLSTPINVWLLGNILQETFFSSISAAITYSYLMWFRKNRFSIGLILVASIGVVAHPLYLVISIYILCVAVYLRRYKFIFLLGLALIPAWLAKEFLFPSSSQPDMHTIIASSVPGVSNILWKMSEVLPIVNGDFLWSKIKHAIVVQFFDFKAIPFFFVSNIGLLSVAILALTQRRKPTAFLLYSIILIMTYSAMLVLFQNQMRYQLFISGVAIINVLLLIEKICKYRLIWCLLTIYVICCSGLNIFLLKRVHTQSAMLTEKRQIIRDQFTVYDESTRYAAVDHNVNKWLALITALPENKFMLIDREVLSKEKISEALSIYGSDVIIATSEFTRDYPEFIARKVGEPAWSGFSGLSIYEVQSSEQK